MSTQWFAAAAAVVYIAAVVVAAVVYIDAGLLLVDIGRLRINFSLCRHLTAQLVVLLRVEYNYEYQSCSYQVVLVLAMSYLSLLRC